MDNSGKVKIHSQDSEASHSIWKDPIFAPKSLNKHSGSSLIRLVWGGGRCSWGDGMQRNKALTKRATREFSFFIGLEFPWFREFWSLPHMKNGRDGWEGRWGKKINLKVVSSKSRASVKVVFQGSSLPAAALLWPMNSSLSYSPPFLIPNRKGRVSRKQDISSGKSCPKAVAREAAVPSCRWMLWPSPCHKFIGKSEKLLWASLPKKAVCSPWQPFLGSPAVKNWVQSSQNSALCPSLFMSFYFYLFIFFIEGIEAGLQHYLKWRCQMKSSSF